ncbi:MAG: YtxH domain-containing protein [Bacteroidota bacterium]|nr:YtxH domain-containing protein [Bacteroidota bacterium]
MKITNSAVLIISGFAIGAITGLLLAPAQGTKTRKKLLKKAKKYKKSLENKVGDYKEKASVWKEDIEGAAHDVKKRFT